MIGASTAWLGILITFGTRLLTTFKFNAVNRVITLEKDGEILRGAAFLTFLVIQTSCVFLASLAVYIEPLSAGRWGGALELGSVLPFSSCVVMSLCVCNVVGYQKSKAT